VAVSYLTQEDITEWAPWFWVLMAFQWTAEQGRPVPPLTLAWRSGSCDLPAHLRTLVAAWMPTATAMTATDDGTHWTVSWRDTRWMAWRARLQDHGLSRVQRRDLARAYAVWHHTLQARQAAYTQREPMISIRLEPDGLSWECDLSEYDSVWEEPVLLPFAHWLQSLVPLLDRIPTGGDAPCTS
jgi:hypothetical protein